MRPVLDPTNDPAARQRRSARALRTESALTVGLSLVVLTVLWLVFIRLGAARQFENFVWESRRVLARRLRVTHNDALNLVTESSMAAGFLGIVVVGVVRRRIVLGATVAAAVVGAAVSSQVLKRLVISRPPTVGELLRISTNSFPSGHATICTSLGLAAIVMTPHRWRRTTTVLAAVWVVYQAIGVLAAGWHRPSDALAGYALALTWMSAAVWLLAVTGRAAPDAEEADRVGSVQRLLGAVALVSVVVLGVAVQVGGDPTMSWAGAAYVGACLTIIAAGVAVVWWFWLMLHDWTLDERTPRDDRQTRDDAVRSA